MASKEEAATEKARAASPNRVPASAIHAKLAERFGPAVTLHDAVDPYTLVEDHARFLEVMFTLRDSLAFDFLRSVSGVDYPDLGRIASVYHLFSYSTKQSHVVKILCDRSDPRAPSVEKIWPAANWFERESFDLLGIIYTGNSDLRRIMLPEDWSGHPLRKDYLEQESYHGIGTTRPSPLEAFRVMDEERRKARDARGEGEPTAQSSPVAPPPGFVPKPKKKVAAAPTEEGADAGDSE